jgi:SWI/SNF-related matrix-associated actin-dependent regulator of chromatin subfamily A3
VGRCHLYSNDTSNHSLTFSLVFSRYAQCNVSLVGQWIEEAKSKLENPGLVYSYHGAGRKRDPQMLAQNSIVVTTYETLSSDATYHARKSTEGADAYSAPCEQVRWWRIICDESHVLRNGSTKKTSAILNLVSDNKWLVSGKLTLGLYFCNLLCNY